MCDSRALAGMILSNWGHPVAVGRWMGMEWRGCGGVWGITLATYYVGTYTQPERCREKL